MIERARERRRADRAQYMSDLNAAVWSQDLRRAIERVLGPGDDGGAEEEDDA